MGLVVIPYTDPSTPGSLAHAIARSQDEVDALVKRLQQPAGLSARSTNAG
jgi:hypothetical protein